MFPRHAPAVQLDIPPTSNTGGKFHAPVGIDWLSFTFHETASTREALRQRIEEWLGLPVLLEERKGGRLGFEHSADLVVPIEGQGAKVGIVAWGGEAQQSRVYVSLPGSACSMFPVDAPARIAADLAALDARITRVDLCCDDLDGAFSVDTAAAWYVDGQFSTGGRMPSHSTHGGWLVPDGSGRTLYIGKSKNGKMLRVYEKGKQLGDAASPWVRWELQLGNKDRVIPYDVLTQTARYFAGGYECLAAIVAVAGEKIKTSKLMLEKSLAHLTLYARRSYGKLVHCLLQFHQGDIGTVVEQLRRRGTPASLSQAWSASALSG